MGKTKMLLGRHTGKPGQVAGASATPTLLRAKATKTPAAFVAALLRALGSASVRVGYCWVPRSIFGAANLHSHSAQAARGIVQGKPHFCYSGTTGRVVRAEAEVWEMTAGKEACLCTCEALQLFQLGAQGKRLGFCWCRWYCATRGLEREASSPIGSPCMGSTLQLAIVHAGGPAHEHSTASADKRPSSCPASAMLVPSSALNSAVLDSTVLPQSIVCAIAGPYQLSAARRFLIGSAVPLPLHLLLPHGFRATPKPALALPPHCNSILSLHHALLRQLFHIRLSPKPSSIFPACHRALEPPPFAVFALSFSSIQALSRLNRRSTSV